MTNRTPFLASVALPGLLCAAILAACGPGTAPSASPPPSARPTPTPIAADVTTPDEAAALVIATNPRFKGATPRTPELVGASKWWVALPLAAGGFRIELTVGWGDCPAGCISRHVWTFEVSAAGQVSLVSETGDAVPASLPA